MQAEGVSNDNIKDDKEVSDLVWNIDGVCVERIGGDFEWCWNIHVDAVDDPIMIV